MKYLTILLIALLSLASSCRKDDMPSDGHKNIFRCKVNGVEWTPHCISDFFGCSAVDCQYYKGSGTISIGAIRQFANKSIDDGLIIYKYGTQLGINQLTYKSEIYLNYNNKKGCKSYYLDTTVNRTIIVEQVDTFNYIIKGSFEFTGLNQCGDTINVTDGFFDLEYRF